MYSGVNYSEPNNYAKINYSEPNNYTKVNYSEPNNNNDIKCLINLFIKYALEGITIAIVAFYIPNTNTNLNEVIQIGLVGSLTFFILDLFSPEIGSGARVGSGFGIGKSVLI
jgi:inner membrane protein involved in colicin E2 resistance